MSQINWLTPAGQISKIAENEYFEYKLDAYDTNGSALTYKVISGKLGSGLQLFRNGLIQGISVIEYATEEVDYAQTFTVRVTNARGQIADRTFTITTTSIAVPIIVPKDTSLGSFSDGDKIHIQLNAIDPSPGAKFEWSVIDGTIPLGTTLTSSGVLSGYIAPAVNSTEVANTGWSNTLWDRIGWDAESVTAQSKTYHFTVRVYDGTRYDESRYSISVIARSSFTADNNSFLVDTSTVTADTNNKYSPFITTVPEDLLPTRQNSNFAFKIEGVDYNGSELRYELFVSDSAVFDQGPTSGNPDLPELAFDTATFDQESHQIPAGLTLDPVTGWLTGEIGSQTEEVRTYTFSVFCYKAAEPVYVSQRVSFTLTVLGDMSNAILWQTPYDLGTIDNGSISEFRVAATSTKGRLLRYDIKSGEKQPFNGNPALETVTYINPSASRLPQGLTLLPDGLIVGRVSFEYFALDNRTTTIDGKNTTFDRNYSFTVIAHDMAGTVSAEKTFTITVNDYNERPYENLYLKALTLRNWREKFNGIVNNTEIFPNNLIYRSNDLFFGKSKDIKFLFAAGIGPNEIPAYLEAMQNNHYTKKIELSNVKTAVALDENFNPKYEVVYVNISDPLTDQGKSPADQTDITGLLSSQYRVPPYNTLYPNALVNMKNEASAVGYTNRGAIPKWMSDQQEDGRVLGFINAVVLAYTIPGASKLIAYRLKQSGISFSDIDFTIDRYHLDNYLTQHFDLSTNEFNVSVETTFDRLPPGGDIHPLVGSVDVALTVPFDEINGRTLTYINLHGGLDGVTTIKSGMKVIFAKQENYNVEYNPADLAKDFFDQNNFDRLPYDLSTVYADYTSPNDGWNNNLSRYGATIDLDNNGADDLNQGYGMQSYALASIVPGYLNSLVFGTDNERGGIWEVTVSDAGVVTLAFIQNVGINESVQVANGNSFGSTRLYYDPIVKPGRSVPEYSVLSDNPLTASSSTRFDGNCTRFYSERDMYAPPGTDDHYLKFPKTSVFR
jgi:hypothetical protein